MIPRISTVTRRRASLLGIAWVVLAAAVVSPTRGAEAASPAVERAAAEARRQRMAAVTSWGYQLRRVDVAHIAASPFDLVVVDYARSRSRGVEHVFTAADVRRMQTRPDGRRRIVLAYLSVGEAEWYRYYWQRGWEGASPPSWLGRMNPEWFGNFPTRFWDSDWQRILLAPDDGYLARIESAGFDGVYLDRPDVHEEWQVERPSARVDMIALIERLARQARARDPAFLVVQQNAEELLTSRALRRTIDAVAKENLIYGLAKPDQRNTPAEIAWSERHLKLAATEGRRIFVVEYLDDPALAREARAHIERQGFVATFAPRPLHALLHEPVDRHRERVVWPETPRPYGPLHAPRPDNY